MPIPPDPAATLRLPLDELPDPLPLPALASGRGQRPIFFARIHPPGSKSLTNRALLLAALADGVSTLHRPLLEAEDARVMVEALGALGALITRSGEAVTVRGVDGAWRPAPGTTEVMLNLGNAGTATRFLAAAALLSPVPVVVDGSPRMRERPIGELGEALGRLGASVEYLGTPGCPPLRIRPVGSGAVSGARPAVLRFPTTASSQFISALLLAAPWLPGGLTVELEGRITSRSYIAMTVGLLDQLGATVRTSDDLRVLRVGPPAGDAEGIGPPKPGLRGFDYRIEPDASGATCFWAAAALFPGATCRIVGIETRSLQGDAGFPEVLSRMGGTVLASEPGGGGPSLGFRGGTTLAPVMADMSDMPDAALALAVVAAFASGRSILRGLGTLRVKESDRIAALQTQLAKIDVRVETDVLGDPETVTVTPPAGGVDCSAGAPPVEFDTYDDHRMAMALALIGLRRPGVSIRDPGCVGKTYPTFWADWAALHG